MTNLKHYKCFIILTTTILLLGGVSANLELEDFQTNPESAANISNVIEISGQISDVSELTQLEIILTKTDKSQEYHVETDEEGYFSKNIFATSTGEYTVKIRHNGEELENSFSRSITVVSHPDIEIKTPEKVEIFEGNTKRVPIELTNTGEEKISSIKLRTQNEDLNLNSTKSLNTLERGRTTKTNFEMNIKDAEKAIYTVNTSVKVFTEKNKTLTKYSSFKLERLTISDITGRRKLESSEEESSETDEVTLTEDSSNKVEEETPLVGQLTVDEGLSLEIMTPVILTILLGYLTGKISTRKGLIEPETTQGKGFNTPEKTVKVPEYAEEDGKFICEKTGKSFESKKGLELYQKLNNLE